MIKLTPLIIKIRLLLFLFLITAFQKTEAQSPLDNYIDSAFARNIVLQQKNISFQKATYALQIAKGMFYPTIGIQAAYTTADGGRNIEIPVGDMLNNVYTTLNQLTSSDKFPQLENQSIDFLPTNFYDMKLHTVVPIINSKLRYNKKIREQQVALSEYEVNIYKRQLAEKVKTAYYQYLQAIEATRIYVSALQLAREGKRVNESLLKNGKGLPAYILRAESEVQQAETKLIEAQQKADDAKRYFNFLLNRNQETDIDTTTQTNHPDKILQLLQSDISISEREELQELNKAIAIRENMIQMNKSAYYPTLNGFLDLGSQAENLKFNRQSRYYMAGLQLDIPIFKGKRNHYRMLQSELDLKNAKLNLKKVSQQLQLSSNVAKNRLQSAYNSFLSAQKQLEAAKAYQRLIERGYKEGVNTYIETIDARNQLTQAQLAVSINRYKMWVALAQLERETASYPIH